MTYILQSVRPCVWTGQEQALTRLLNYFAQKMADNHVRQRLKVWEKLNCYGTLLFVLWTRKTSFSGSRKI
jgi:hypothetical protein